MNKKIFFFTFLLISCISSYGQYSFNHVAIGGGGFVTGIINHKTSGDIYCRTDIGGAYRLNTTSGKWVQLFNWLSEDESGFAGVESLAIDPQNPNNVYMLCGISYVGGGRTAILKSTDKGNTFTYTDVTSKFKAHGNGYGRGNGERLAVDPNNSNVLFCGTRANGLWKSTDAGVTWNLAWNGVTSTPNGNGISFVIFDPSTASGGTTKTMYIGVSRTGSDTFYKSSDGGVTFTPMSPTTGFMPHRAVLQGTTMYVTYADSEGPGTSNAGRVFKLNTSTGVWTNVTPLTWGSTSLSYGGVDIDPANVNRVVISTTGVYNNNQYGTNWGDFIYLSTDGGSTWTEKIGNSTFDNNGIGAATGQVNWAECAVFDPFNSNKVRVVGGGGIFTCDNITLSQPTWKYDVKGVEETAFLDGISVPGGPFICAMGDMDGFLYNDLTAYPAQFLQPSVGTNRSVALAGANPNRLVRTSDAGSHVYYSTNMGYNWTACPSSMGYGGRAALTADGATIVHAPDGNNKIFYSTNNGSNWTESTGINISAAVPVADPVNSNYVYVYNPNNGGMYVSSNKGVSFSNAGTAGYTSTPWTPTVYRAVPGYEGHIWVPRAGNGLSYSMNHGQTFTTLSNVSYCNAVGIGKKAPSASYPTIYIWGTVGGVKGLYRSINQGTNWTRLNDDDHEFGGNSLIVGDLNIYGRIYIPGVGGIVYVDDTTANVNYVTLANRGTGLLIDGMYRTGNGNGDNVGQWSNSASDAQQWSIESMGNYVMIKNKNTGLYIDGLGRTSNPSIAGLWAYSASDAQKWTQEDYGSGYFKFKNKATGLYLDGLGSSTNGDDLGQWSSSTSYNQQWSINIIGSSQAAKTSSTSKKSISEEPSFSIGFYPNPFVNDFKVEVVKSEGPFRVAIFDILGRKVETAESSTSSQLSMGSSLKPGLYIVQVEGVNSNYSKTFKIVKK